MAARRNDCDDPADGAGEHFRRRAAKPGLKTEKVKGSAMASDILVVDDEEDIREM